MYVNPLFTNVPIDIALDIIHKRAKDDQTWKALLEIDTETLIKLLKLCLKNTPFQWKGEYYNQISGTSMGNILSMFVAGVMMEHIDNKVNKAML